MPCCDALDFKRREVDTVGVPNAPSLIAVYSTSEPKDIQLQTSQDGIERTFCTSTRMRDPYWNEAKGKQETC